MRIATLGAGRMPRALGHRWVAAGHEVFIGARHLERAAAIGHEIGAAHGSLLDAVDHGEVLLLAVPGAEAPDVITSMGGPDGRLAGRVIIDCTNALGAQAFSDPPRSFVLTRNDVAAEVARRAAGASVVKCFSMLAAEVWEAHSSTDVPLLVPICADDPAAIQMVAGLVRDLDAQPVDAGGLLRAGYVEAMAAFVMGLWFGGHDAGSMLPDLASAAAE